MATPFEMRAGLPKKEPKMLEDWEKNHVYEKMIEHNADLPRFVLHDGPPYANGNIHMGTALNKIIKDIIIRDKNMEGFQAPYVPGFDTHGLPIELKALSSLGDKKAGISKLELRQICEKFATEHIDIMSDQFKRLGVIGDFEHPPDGTSERPNRPCRDVSDNGGSRRLRSQVSDRMQPLRDGGTMRDVCRSNRMVATKQDRLRSDRRKKRLPAIRTESLTSKSDSQKRGS